MRDGIFMILTNGWLVGCTGFAGWLAFKSFVSLPLNRLQAFPKPTGVWLSYLDPPSQSLNALFMINKKYQITNLKTKYFAIILFSF